MGKKKRETTSKKRLPAVIGVLAILLVIAAAVYVRLPQYVTDRDIVISSEDMDRHGLTYLREMDSYYHVRVAYEIAEKGEFGVKDGPGGEAWDHLSFAPEGRSAEYRDGLMRVTVCIWRIIDFIKKTELIAVCYWISLLFGALTAAAAFALGQRATGSVIGAMTAAVLTACAPAFVNRSPAGNYDTDMIQPLFNILLLLTMTELLRAVRYRRGIIWGLLFGIVSGLYTCCWNNACFGFIMMALGGGLVCATALAVLKYDKEKILLAGYGAAWISMISFVTLLNSFTYFTEFIGRLTGRLANNSGADGGTDLPNTLISVDELKNIDFFPGSFKELLSAYDGSGEMTVVTGVGGMMVIICALAGIAVLAARVVKKLREENWPVDLIYLTVFVVWLTGCIAALRMGMRMTEHLALPVALFAAVFAGNAAPLLNKLTYDKRTATALAVCIMLLACIPVVIASSKLDGTTGSQASDASELAMNWIKENADSNDAIIEAWWDEGYYYEYESGHPALWDGGSQDSLRAVLVGRAFVTEDIEESKAMLRMLATSGNNAAAMLGEKLGYEEGLPLLYKMLTAGRDDSIAMMTGSGLDAETAEEIEGLVHPDDPREAYLVISSANMNIRGWIDYYGSWKPGGDNPRPGDEGFGTPEELAEKREREAISRLFNDNIEKPAFRCYDDNGTVSVWRIS